MRNCSRCKELKDESLFYKCSRHSSGLQYTCKNCHLERKRLTPKKPRHLWNRKIYMTEEERQEGERISRKKTWLKIRYGITLDDVDRMREEQGGLCAIVGCSNDAEAVDHCHSTGKVRGLLCLKCNTALGMLEDNIDKAVGVVRYLRIHKELRA